MSSGEHNHGSNIKLDDISHLSSSDINMASAHSAMAFCLELSAPVNSKLNLIFGSVNIALNLCEFPSSPWSVHTVLCR